MRKAEIKVGGRYRAKVSGVLTTVRVDEVTDDRYPGRTRGGTRWHVTNLRTGRKTVFRSAQRFRCETDPHNERQIDLLPAVSLADVVREGKERRPFRGTSNSAPTFGGSGTTGVPSTASSDPTPTDDENDWYEELNRGYNLDR